ncbi:protein phosphatase 2C [Testicularia cyperi]|uniref:Protein phosphatase 2C n=1 Tax=Testicularia cyperi TaxID=1882483 RepID=A0A317XZ48_9BASI|nr:protein phosphatase 2C [Testicularia cyperi]
MEARQPRKALGAQDAESVPVTVAQGQETHGILNQHPGPVVPSNGISSTLPFRVGISEDCNKRWRRTMEDSHAFVYDFGGVPGQGFFGIFDGHAGKHAAEWCGQNFHTYLLETLSSSSGQAVPDLLNKTFHAVDKQLSNVAREKGTTSGCTAVVAFLRLEDESGQASSPVVTGSPSTDGKASKRQSAASGASSEGLWGRLSRRFDGNSDSKNSKQDAQPPQSKHLNSAQASSSSRRVLYTANVGDARAVLCRGGTAVRLTYDHKGSDAQEAKRITDAGGFVMNNRVNGVLAVTRSLGDSAMKEFVVGSPYTTETVLGDDDSFLIVACDGLWDVTEDQEAIDLVRDEQDPQKASQMLLEHAMANFSTDNTSVMVIRFHSPTSA